ncbi:MAG: cell division protein FtsQ/DivIB [Gammaproteobacteria bacterium]|nr:MAG: cell division protein FtsQ/DivIB [Gammaproteobacteria bacterium]
MNHGKGKTLHSPFQYFKMALLGTVVLSCVYAINQIKLSQYFPIKTVRVYGINRINHDEIQNLLLPLVNRGFFKVNVDYIRDRLQQLPWVSEIAVRRNWPDQVDITVIEKNPIARWNGQNLLSESGEVFIATPDLSPTHLPIFNGPEGKQVMMLQYFNQLNQVLQPIHARIAVLEMTPYFTWKLTLDNGIALQVGHKDILTRLSHFVKVYPKIVGNRAADVEYIDLRYSNGMAVRWKTT